MAGTTAESPFTFQTYILPPAMEMSRFLLKRARLDEALDKTAAYRPRP